MIQYAFYFPPQGDLSQTQDNTHYYNGENDPFKSLQTSWWQLVSGPQFASGFSCAARPPKLKAFHTESGHSEVKQCQSQTLLEIKPVSRGRT